ncbi:MAG: pyridoxamine 5'-phosphate oxidase family protein [Synergistaceae bacterium]|nr:pyridoxamine 5'-phosphate oxidase family protein [Synergistaceae bacterium]
MKEVLEFLSKAGVFFLATADGDQPRVRPLGFVMDCGGKLAFCTGNNKPMCKQLAANPKVEISAVDDKCNTLRITGTVKFATTPETQKKALEVMPSLSKIYSVGDGKFEIFYLDEGKAVCSTMSGESKELPL